MKIIARIFAILAAVLSLTAAKVYRDSKLPIDIDDSSTYVYTTKKDWIEYLMISTEPESTKKEEISTEQGETGERYRITAYIPDEEWGYRTSTGVTSRHLQTCAVDPNVIPLGSTIVVYGDNGQVLELFACDIGGGVKGKHIDVFYDGTEAEAYDWLFRFGEYQVVEIK